MGNIIFRNGEKRLEAVEYVYISESTRCRFYYVDADTCRVVRHAIQGGLQGCNHRFKAVRGTVRINNRDASRLVTPVRMGEAACQELPYDYVNNVDYPKDGENGWVSDLNVAI